MPAISETIDWAANTGTSAHPGNALDAQHGSRHAKCDLLKFQEDIENVKGEVAAITAKVAK